MVEKGGEENFKEASTNMMLHWGSSQVLNHPPDKAAACFDVGAAAWFEQRDGLIAEYKAACDSAEAHGTPKPALPTCTHESVRGAREWLLKCLAVTEEHPDNQSLRLASLMLLAQGGTFR